jgi:hypothetical protein
LWRDGRAIPVQASTLATWDPPQPDRPSDIRWLRLDFVDDLASGGQQNYELRLGDHRDAADDLKVTQDDAAIVIDAGRLRWSIPRVGRSPRDLLAGMVVDGRPLSDSAAILGFYVTDESGRRYWSHADETANVVVESSGPLAAIVCARGWFINRQGRQRALPGEPVARPDGGFCRYVTRFYLQVGIPEMRIQHTIIFTEDSDRQRYGDIGLVLPASQSTTQFGSVEQAATGPVYLLQHAWDQFEVRSDAKSQVVAQGERAHGWMRNGSIAVTHREFWQNYPKELSVDPTSGVMTVHFWPAHGRPRIDAPPAFNYDNGWRLPFAHSGPLLDFRAPESFANPEVFPARMMYWYPKEALGSNALGVAKTHELLVNFAAGDETSDRAEAFQRDPHLLATPVYMEQSQALRPLTASDPARFPVIENALSRPLRWVIQTKAAYHAYGMWNWGDVNHYFEWEHDKIWPAYRRLWTSTHHGYVRWPWWQYLRDGDPLLLEQARAHARHIMDVDVCHWTNADFAARGGQRDEKRVGGMCDYEGLVHWHGGNQAYQNALIDFMLYDYYLTGNQRAWDVAMEHGYFTLTGAVQPNQGREAAAQANLYYDLYRATWDPKVGARLHEAVAAIMRTPFDHHHALHWAPWVFRYWELTGNAQAAKYIQDWADREVYAEFSIAPLAYAYYVTGDRSYAKRAAAQALTVASMVPMRNDALDGMVGREWYINCMAARDTALAMKALRDAQLTAADLTPEEWGRDGWPIVVPYRLANADNVARQFGGAWPWPGDTSFARAAVCFYRPPSLRHVDVGLRRTSAKASVRLIAPNGDVVHEMEREHSFAVSVAEHSGKVRELQVRGKDDRVIHAEPFESMQQFARHASVPYTFGDDAPAGVYRLEYQTTSDHQIMDPLPALDTRAKVWFPVRGNAVAIEGVQYFYVPPQTERFELHFLPSYVPPTQAWQKTMISAGVIYNGDLAPVTSINCGLSKQPQIIAIEAPPEQRGRVWCVVARDCAIVNVRGIPPWLAPSWHAFSGEPIVPSME